jgi:hypothetical protein
MAVGYQRLIRMFPSLIWLWKTSLLVLAECPLPFVCSQSMVGPTVMFDIAPPSYGFDLWCKMNRYISAHGKNFSPNFPFPPCLEWSHSPLTIALPVAAVSPALCHKCGSQCRSPAPPTLLHRSPEPVPSHRRPAVLPPLLHKSGSQRRSPFAGGSRAHYPFCWPSNSISPAAAAHLR